MYYIKFNKIRFMLLLLESTARDQIDKFLPTAHIKRLFNEGKLLSFNGRSLQEGCSQYKLDKNACKRYVEHLEVLDAKDGRE